MRKINIIPDEYYHIYNRGNNKQNIFMEEKDWLRFLFLILYFQSPVTFYNINVGHRVSHVSVSKKTLEKILSNRTVELISFANMPNHFHMIVKEISNNGISRYMQRILNSYTKYFNTKYKKSGHLFQGPFQIKHIENNEQLLHLSAYIHRNPREIKEWKNKEHLYPWSSYQDYINKNRWGDILKTQIILDQFSNNNEYKDFIETSGVKPDLEEELLLD